MSEAEPELGPQSELEATTSDFENIRDAKMKAEAETIKPYFDVMRKLNPVFNKQKEIAQNLSKLRVKAYNSHHDMFADDTENIIKTVGIKAITDTNPELGEAMEEANLIDKIINPNRANELIKSRNKIEKKIKEIQEMPNDRGWNTKANSIVDDLEKFGYISDPRLLDDPEKYTKNKAEQLKQYKFPFPLDSADAIKKTDTNQLHNYLKANTKAASKVQDRLKAYRTDLQEQIESYIPEEFKSSRQVAIDSFDEFYKSAEPVIDAVEELKKYKDQLTPEVMTKLENEVQQIKDYINDARLKGVDAGKLEEHIKLVNKVRNNVKNHYQDILNKLNAYSQTVHDEDAIISEIKSLASYEQYTQLPPDIFERLPENIKSKVMRLMELKAKLQKQQGKTKNISQKYKINASNKPVSEDEESAKVLNPMLNRGYAIFNKVAQHNAYNAGFL